MRVADIEQIYDRGVNLVEKRLASSNTQPIDRTIADLIKFRRSKVAWSTLDEREMWPPNVKGFPARMVVMPGGHPRISGQGTLLYADVTHDPALFIKPARIAVPFAGIGLLHELVHLQDWVSGFEKRGSSDFEYGRGEIRGHEIELRVAELVSEGRYVDRLRDHATSHGLSGRAIWSLMLRGVVPRSTS